MSIQSNFPALKPTLLLDFANVKQLDPRITFTRASEGRYYDGKTFAKAEENLLLQSQDFTTSWVNVNSTDAANTEVAPDGTTTADTLTDNATSGTHSVYQGVSVSANTDYVVSCFIKAGTSDYAILAFTDASSAQRYFSAEFNLDTGVVSRTANGSSGTLTSSSITSVGNGWYRCVIIGQVSAVSTGNRIYVGLSDGSSALGSFGIGSYVGTGTDIYAWGAQLEQRSSVTAYTATTTQPITNYIPVLMTAANGVARFDHNPVTEESLGLLIEEQRTNLLTYSAQFDNAAWSDAGSIVKSANVIVSPDGTLSADKISAGNTTNVHGIQQASVAVSNGAAYTLSCYAKAAEYGFLWFDLFDGSNRRTWFNLTNGTVGTNAAGSTATITSVGNGWYRCSISRTVASASVNAAILVSVADNSPSYLGDNYSGIFIWGAQLEAGAFPTSYIPTVAAQVTRSADTAVMTGANFSSWFSNDQGTLYAESSLFGNFINRDLVSLSNGTSSEEMTIRWTSGSQAQFVVDVNAVTQASIAPSGYTTAGVVYKRAAAYRVNDFEQAINGASVGTDTSGLVPVVNQMNFTGPTGLTVTLNGHIRKIAYYPLRLSSSNLQALTS